jgi:hypothetical protein
MIMYAVLERVAVKHRLLAGATQSDTDHEVLHGNFLVHYAHESTAIEADTLIMKETRTILQEGIAVGGKLLRKHFEVMT